MVMSVPRLLHGLSTLLVISLAAGCGGDGGGGTGPAGTGNLIVTVTQAGAARATVHVTGPAGYSHTLSFTTTLTGLPVGTYTVTGDSAQLPDTIVGATVFAAHVGGSPATVTKDETTNVTVGYAFAYGRGALWLTSPANAQAVGFGADQLRVPGAVPPRATLSSYLPNGMAFDASGTMWLSSVAEDTLRAFTIDERSRSGVVESSHTLQSASLEIPEQMAFDPNGTLWIADQSNELLGFSAAQLTAGGSGITPAFHVADTSSLDPRMQSIAFDADGNAWVAEAGLNQVVEFTHAQLATAGVVAPAVRLTFPFSDPVDLVFDAHHDLWVANSVIGVIMFTPAQLAGIGPPPEPEAILSTPVPHGLAFDNNGSVWVSNSVNATIDVYSASTLTSGTAALVQRITPDLGQDALSSMGRVVFDPWIVLAPAP
jgi:sugar lactone lactonase YvrE